MLIIHHCPQPGILYNQVRVLLDCDNIQKKKRKEKKRRLWGCRESNSRREIQSPSFFSVCESRIELIFVVRLEGVRTGLHLSCLCMCNIRGLYVLIARICGSGQVFLTRGTCVVTRRLEVVAVAGLLCISWYVLGAAGFRFFDLLFVLRTHTACCKYEAASRLIYLSTSTSGQSGIYFVYDVRCMCGEHIR